MGKKTCITHLLSLIDSGFEDFVLSHVGCVPNAYKRINRYWKKKKYCTTPFDYDKLLYLLLERLLGLSGKYSSTLMKMIPQMTIPPTFSLIFVKSWEQTGNVKLCQEVIKYYPTYSHWFSKDFSLCKLYSGDFSFYNWETLSDKSSKGFEKLCRQIDWLDFDDLFDAAYAHGYTLLTDIFDTFEDYNDRRLHAYINRNDMINIKKWVGQHGMEKATGILNNAFFRDYDFLHYGKSMSLELFEYIYYHDNYTPNLDVFYNYARHRRAQDILNFLEERYPLACFRESRFLKHNDDISLEIYLPFTFDKTTIARCAFTYFNHLEASCVTIKHLLEKDLNHYRPLLKSVEENLEEDTDKLRLSYPGTLEKNLIRRKKREALQAFIDETARNIAATKIQRVYKEWLYNPERYLLKKREKTYRCIDGEIFTL
jgi:hypothetical protein